MNLVTLTKLAKENKVHAEAGVLQFVHQQFSDLGITKVQINQSAISLNSVNGFLTDQSAREYFFKFHAEENEQTTIDEYYNTQELVKVGLPVIEPLYQSTASGSQFLIYEKITAPIAFDLFNQPELFFPAERQLLQQVTSTYRDTLELTASEQLITAPIYQLFYHRLDGVRSRVEQYYLSNKWFRELMNKTWIINNKTSSKTLYEIILQSRELLNPLHYDSQPTVIGHGDDHNGNKFMINGQFKFFDPAFAGRQPALLSFVKATAHNTFVHPDWLYTPELLAEHGLRLDWQISSDAVVVNHNWQMPADRAQELQLQETLVWKPLISELRRRNWLPKDWQQYLCVALFCCPFLVYNLLDRKRYTEVASVLALSKCIELYNYDCNY